jgi:hypothetical protein
MKLDVGKFSRRIVGVAVRVNQMRAMTKARCATWALLLSWPWLVWAVAKYSPEMIQKGIDVSATVWAPLVADTVLCMGGWYAIRTRRGLVQKAAQPTTKLYHGPHFGRVAQRQKSGS